MTDSIQEKKNPLPLFKGSSQPYVAIAAKENSVLLFSAAINTGHSIGLTPGVNLTLRFAQLFKSRKDRASSKASDVTPFSGRAFVGYQQLDSRGHKQGADLPVMQLNKIVLHLSDEIVGDGALASQWHALGGSVQIAAWVEGLLADHDFDMKCSVEELAQEIERLVIGASPQEPFILELPSTLPVDPSQHSSHSLHSSHKSDDIDDSQDLAFDDEFSGDDEDEEEYQ